MATDQRAVLEHIRELIATPTVSSVSPEWDMPNAPLIARLAERLESQGWRVEIQDIPNRPGKQNLIASLGPSAEKGAGLVLAGHTDTVPCDAGLWSSDPFAVEEREQRLYGLGTADMKSFLALAAAAAAEIDPATLARPLTLLATADEESSMSGARALVAAGKPQARYAVIGEPTGLRPIRLHKGIFMEAIRITGQSGHSSNPALGHNALEGMHAAIAELLSWRDELRAGPLDNTFEIPYTTLNLGHIHGGDNPNRICGQTELQIDLRFVPSLDRDDLRHELHTRLARAVASANPALKLEFEALFAGADAMNTPANSALVQAAERLTGESAGSVAYATEAPFLASLDMEVVVLGPGFIDQAHQPDEYVPLNQLQTTIDHVQALIREFCLK
jgi:acetylornithine deacetylase